MKEVVVCEEPELKQEVCLSIELDFVPRCPRCGTIRGQWRGFRERRRDRLIFRRRWCKNCGRWFSCGTAGSKPTRPFEIESAEVLDDGPAELDPLRITPEMVKEAENPELADPVHQWIPQRQCSDRRWAFILKMSREELRKKHSENETLG